MHLGGIQTQALEHAGQRATGARSRQRRGQIGDGAAWGQIEPQWHGPRVRWLRAAGEGVDQAAFQAVRADDALTCRRSCCPCASRQSRLTGLWGAGNRSAGWAPSPPRNRSSPVWRRGDVHALRLQRATQAPSEPRTASWRRPGPARRRPARTCVSRRCGETQRAVGFQPDQRWCTWKPTPWARRRRTPGAQQRAALQIEAETRVPSCRQGVHAEPARPVAQCRGIEIAQLAGDRIGAGGVALHEAVGRFGVGEVEATLAGEQELAPDRAQALVQVHADAGGAGPLQPWTGRPPPITASQEWLWLASAGPTGSIDAVPGWARPAARPD